MDTANNLEEAFLSPSTKSDNFQTSYRRKCYFQLTKIHSQTCFAFEADLNDDKFVLRAHLTRAKVLEQVSLFLLSMLRRLHDLLPNSAPRLLLNDCLITAATTIVSSGCIVLKR